MNNQIIPGIEDRYGTQILSIFKFTNPKDQLILFGSRAKGNYREGSDIDLAVIGAEFTEKDKIKWLLAYDELFLPWKIDIVLYDQIKEQDLKNHIDRVGKTLLQPKV